MSCVITSEAETIKGQQVVGFATSKCQYILGKRFINNIKRKTEKSISKIHDKGQCSHITWGCHNINMGGEHTGNTQMEK